MERFAPGMNPVIYHGTVDVRKQRKSSLLAAGAEGLRNTIVITNYDTVIRDKKVTLTLAERLQPPPFNLNEV